MHWPIASSYLSNALNSDGFGEPPGVRHFVHISQLFQRENSPNVYRAFTVRLPTGRSQEAKGKLTGDAQNCAEISAKLHRKRLRSRFRLRQRSRPLARTRPGPGAQNLVAEILLITRSDSGDDLDPSLVHRLEPLSLLLGILVWDGADGVVTPAVAGTARSHSVVLDGVGAAMGDEPLAYCAGCPAARTRRDPGECPPACGLELQELPAI
jgi:hypothetical protein